MLLSSVDWALRGGTCALVLLIAAALLRDHGRLIAARLAALFAVGTGAYAITSAAGFSAQLGLWTVPLLALSAGNNVVFWALTAALFDDGFRLRWWHVALWLAAGGRRHGRLLPSSPPLGLGLTLSSFAFAVLAMAQAVTSWRADLVEGRRRLRLFVVGASSLYIGLMAVAQLAGVQRVGPGKRQPDRRRGHARHCGHRRLVPAARRRHPVAVRGHGACRDRSREPVPTPSSRATSSSSPPWSGS